MKKRRGRREIEVASRRRGGVKRGESKLASNQFPKWSPQPRTPRKSHKVEKRKGRKEFLLFNHNPKKIHMHLSIHTHRHTHTHLRAFLVAQMVKNLPVMWKTWVQSLS